MADTFVTPVAPRSAWRRVRPAIAAVVVVGGLLLLRPRPGPTPTAEVSNLPRMEGAAIVLPPGFVKLAEIATAPVELRTVAREVTVPGHVDFDPEHVAAVGTRARGVVDKVLKFEGDLVQPDDVLAQVDSPDLSHAQGEALALAAQSEAARANARREQSLHAQGTTSQRDMELAKATAEQLQAALSAARAKVATLAKDSRGGMGVYELRAPLAGVVVERALHTGQTIEGNVVAFRVANLDQLWVELAVSERYLNGLKRGDAVEIRPIAGPEEHLTGQIAYVGDVIDPLTGSAPVRVEISNKERKLRPGQSVTATIRLTQSGPPGLAVPESAVTPIDGKLHVFLELAPHRVQPTPIETGATDDGWVEVRAGLKAGDKVVTHGVFALKSELFR